MELETTVTSAQYFRQAAPGRIVFFGKAIHETGSIIELGIDGTSENENDIRYTVLKSSGPLPFPKEYISVAEAFALTDANTQQSIHAIYYPPKNPHYESGNEGELPPVVVSIHGGPHYKADQGLDWQKQLFTSRGFAWYVVRLSPKEQHGLDSQCA